MPVSCIASPTLSHDENTSGKKLFWFTRKVKGKRVKTESDWRDYHGSNEELLEDVEAYGKENFERVILRLCKTKSEMSYFEAKEQFETDCLLKPDEYYNGWIMVRVRRNQLGIGK